MKKGFTAPIVLVILTFLLLASVSFWVYFNNLNLSSSEGNIKGATSSSNAYAKPGFSVYVTSKSSTWELIEYLCGTYEECTTSLESGKRWNTVGGGSTPKHEVLVAYDNEWSKYKFIKYYVKTAWVSGEKLYKIVDLGDVPGSKSAKVVSGKAEYDVVITPLDSIAEKFYKSATFSDN